jgi:outer membrane protein TolC
MIGKEAVMFLPPLRARWLCRSLLVAGVVLPGCADSAADRDVLVPPTIRLVQRFAGVDVAIEPVASTPKDSTHLAAVPVTMPAPIVPVSAVEVKPPLSVEVKPASFGETPKPAPALLAPAVEAAHRAPVVVEEKPLPINLDTVLHLAEEQNPQIALARARLQESEINQDVAAKSWLPKVLAGAGYYRHEGGIQNEDGTLTHSSMGLLYPGIDIRADVDLKDITFQRVNAERQAWQSRGELSKITSETLLEAATTYVDLVTARRGEQVSRELEKYLLSLQTRAEKVGDRTAMPLVEAIRAEVAGRRQAIAKLRQQGDAASAKLAYLLGLGPDVVLVPVDEGTTPIDLVDPSQPLAEMVARATANGPGVRELQSLLGTLQSGMDEMSGLHAMLPVMSLMVSEGAYGAGPGGEIAFDNRLDAGLAVSWNLTAYLTARDARRLAENRIEQARLTGDDLRGKLTAGVRESRDGSLSGREQIRHSASAIEHAAESYKLSDKRLTDSVPGATAVDVLHAIRGLEAAHYNYLTCVSAYNKSQLRLLVLLGPAECAPKHP